MTDYTRGTRESTGKWRDYVIESEALLNRVVLIRAQSKSKAVAAIGRIAMERKYAHSWARYEHAFLLRCEQLKYKDVGARLGVSAVRARQMTLRFVRRLKWAMRDTKVWAAR